MFRPAFRALGFSALVSVFGFGTAHAFVINDFAEPLSNSSYWGGDQAGGIPTGSDVIGGAGFEIFNATVTRTVGGVLTVVIKTNYVPGTLGTDIGALFLGQGPFTPSGLDTHHAGDTFLDSPSRFSYALIPNIGGTATLQPLIGDGTDVTLSHASGGDFRHDQAVGWHSAPGSAPALGNAASWSFVNNGGDNSLATANTLTFTLAGAGILPDDLTVAWAMTCANDVLAGSGAPGGNDEVPLPAGFILMGSMLLGAGGVAKWRSRRAKRAA
jgi:hypothetical protein